MEFLKNIQNLYIKAKRTALLAQENQSKKWFHLFSVIEALPEDIQDYSIPDDTWHNNIIRSEFSEKKDLYSFYLMVNEFDDINDAVLLFDNPFKNNIIDGQENYFFNTEFITEPGSDYPYIIPNNIHKSEGIASIIPKRQSGCFVWSKIDKNRSVEIMFKRPDVSKEMKAISSLTDRWLGFDIWTKPEHIGNIYLVAPNPYFRSMDISLSTSPMGIFYQLNLRHKIKNNFYFRIIDKHGKYLALDKYYKIKDRVGLVELPHEPHVLEVKIYNSNEDLIGIIEPSTFIKSFHFDMQIKQADFKVKYQDKDGTKEFLYEKFSGEKTKLPIKENDIKPEYYFTNAEKTREYQKNEEKRDFVFFKGSKDGLEKSRQRSEAAIIVKELINKAKNRCFICDPYFCVSDLIEFAFQIRQSNVDLKILNAKEFIKKDEAKLLNDAIIEYNSKPFQKIECRMLKGDSILHDRFIIADRNVWYIGTSFNQIGQRATCIAKVPLSDDIQIIKEVEKWFNNEEYTQSIKDYINE